MMHAHSTIRPAPAQPGQYGPARALGAILTSRSLAPAILVTIYVAFVLGVGLSRSYIGYDETDYLLFFVPDAERFLTGEPLSGAFHPPLYSILIAGARVLLGDWLAAGIAVSLVFGVVGLVCSCLLFDRLGGPEAAWGVGLTLMGSGIFIGESARSSADVMFFALFVAACLLALEASSSGSRRLWAACGLVVGLALITRTNGPPLLLLALAPFLCAGPRRESGVACLHVIAGIALPILAIAAYGGVADSNVWPTNNHLSLATSYFSGGEDRNSLDAALRVAGRFGSISEVLLHDPFHIATTYLRDLYQLLSADLMTLVEFPLYLMFLPGLLLVVARRWSAALALMLAIALAELLLTNLKQFQARYYLFLVPLIGAAVGHTCRQILGLEWSAPWRTILASALALMFVTAIGLAFLKTYRGTHQGMVELAELVPASRGLIESGAAIVARKPHLAFYAGAENVHLPELDTLAELHAFLRPHAARAPLYLLYGELERRLRPQFKMLRTAAGAPDWLEVVAASAVPGQWVLYRYRPRPSATKLAPTGEPGN
jgi:4-amino-4-deoxy-L-arabinose transferase-like glycosyltransferase